MASARLPRVAAVTVKHLRAPRPDGALFDGSYETCVVEVRADNGVLGVGETDSMASAVRGMIEGPSAHSRAQAMADVLVGQQFDDPTRLWHEVYEATSYIGRRGISMHALGAVDLALWDLLGKVESVAVHELLSTTKHHERVSVYGTVYPLPRTRAGVQEVVGRSVSMGLQAHKICADPWWFEDLTLTSSLLATVRDVIGPEARLIVDAALAYTDLEDAYRLIVLLEAVGAWFLEAPLPLDDVEGHAQVATRFPIGVGDLGLTHAREFAELLDAGAAIAQPDITMVGGITGIRAIAETTRLRERRLIPHGYKTDVTTAATLQFLAAEPDPEPMMEYSLSLSPLRKGLVHEDFPIEEDGTLIVPSRPGLGVTLNEETVRRFAV